MNHTILLKFSNTVPSIQYNNKWRFNGVLLQSITSFIYVLNYKRKYLEGM